MALVLDFPDRSDDPRTDGPDMTDRFRRSVTCLQIADLLAQVSTGRALRDLPVLQRPVYHAIAEMAVQAVTKDEVL